MKRNAFLPLLVLLGCKAYPPLPVVETVDLERYAGTWYEWARFDHSFERGCTCSMAEYAVAADHVTVRNTCFDGGEVSTTQGKAFPVEGSNNAKLKVQFFWPFKGDYYILELDPNYQYALIGAPNRKYLWILGRSDQPDEAVVEQLLKKAESLGFDTSVIIRTQCSGKP